MMDQDVYNAVSQRFSSFNADTLYDVIASRMDISFVASQVQHAIDDIVFEQARPSVLYRPNISQDGNAWSVLLGDNIAVGVCGYGDTPAEAMADFDKHWTESLSKAKGIL